MMSEWRLAWRNVWRNPRRTGLTVAATVFAAFLTMMMVGLTGGMYGKIIEDSVRLASGHAMVAASGYIDDRSLDHSFILDEALIKQIEETPGVEEWAPRIQSYGLVSVDVTSRGVGLLGVMPDRERSITTLHSRVSEGRFLSPGGEEREVVLGVRLAEHIGAKVGDDVLVYGMAYSLETAYELFRVVGLIRLPEPRLERTLALVHMGVLQEFLVFDDRISEIAVLATHHDLSLPVRDALVSAIGGNESPLVVYAWPEILPELEQMVVMDRTGMQFMVAILLVVVGFGILNTVLMAVLERQRELGVMLALGLRPRAVFRMVFMESIVLAALGLVIGIALVIPIALWWHANPIELTGNLTAVFEAVGGDPVITFDLALAPVIRTISLILFVAVLASIYPAIKASRANPVEALRSV